MLVWSSESNPLGELIFPGLVGEHSPHLQSPPTPAQPMPHSASPPDASDKQSAVDLIAAARDFPAAHSMDSSWFAVDAHGHVGVFESSEEGAVPANSGPEHRFAGSAVFIDFVSRGILELDIEDLLALAPGIWVRKEDGWRRPLATDRHYAVLLQLANKKAMNYTIPKSVLFPGWLKRPRKLGNVATCFAHSSGALAYFSHMDGDKEQALLEHLLEEGIVLRAWSHFKCDTRRVGLYSYEHWDTYLPGPYVAGRRPNNPFVADQETAAEFGEVRLPVDFHESRLVQPVGYVECETWRDRDWVDENGRVHWHTPRQDSERVTSAGRDMPPAAMGPIPSDRYLAPLIFAYLDGEPNSGEVLNDALEEQSRRRLVTDGDARHRLCLTLRHLIPLEKAFALATDFAAHVLDLLETPSPDSPVSPASASLPAEAKQLLQCRRDLDGMEVAAHQCLTSYVLYQELTPEIPADISEKDAARIRDVLGHIRTLGHAIENAWPADNGPFAMAVWAFWTLAFGQPRHTAAAAHTARESELAWQVLQVKQAIASG